MRFPLRRPTGYLWRWRRKGGVQDLQKCKQCIDYLISECERGYEWKTTA